MYKLTPQYIVSYDQVNTCFLHVQRRERGGAGKGWEARGEVVIGGRGGGGGYFHWAFSRHSASMYALFVDNEFVRFELTIFRPYPVWF